MVSLSNKNLIYSCDFNYLSIVEPYIEHIINSFKEVKKNRKTSNDLTLPFSHPLYDKLSPKIEEIITTHFFTGKKLQKYVTMAVYIQNNESYTSILHDHQSSLGSIAGVFYYNLPKEGGKFYYKYLDGDWGEENEIQLQENKLYLFPAWLPHKPLPQQDSSYRVCFNIMYPSNERAIHKLTRNRW